MMADNIVSFDVQALVDSWLEAERNGVQFPVPFDAAWQIAGYSTKASGKRGLKGLRHGKHFSTQVLKTSSGGRPSESIQLSCDAMKHLCLMADTPEGEQVRDFFIDAEKQVRAMQSAMTPMEMIAALANKMVEVERKEKEQDRQITALEIENDRLKSQMHILEANQDETRLTAQRADSEVMRFRHHRMENGDWFSIKGWAALHKVKLGNTKAETQKTSSALGKAATAWCKNNDVTKDSTYDPDYGTVGIYPQQALIHAYAVVLGVITSELSA